MRVSDVYASVAALTGDNALESAKWFYHNLNRSIAQLNRVRPFEKYVTLAHFLPKTVLTQEGVILTDQGIEFFGEGVTGVYFIGQGAGAVTVSASAGGSVTKAWDAPVGTYEIIKINIKTEFGEDSADVTLSFQKGSRIGNLALFSSYIGNGPVPSYGDYCEYDITDYTDDFMEFSDLPLIHASQYVDEELYRYANNIIMLPRVCPEGEYEVWYRRKLKEAEFTDFPENDEELVDVRDGMEDLLVLLCGYYCNQYSEPEAAEVFRRDYLDQLQMYIKNMQIPREGAVFNKNGWM